jgi:hypothetical protein
MAAGFDGLLVEILVRRIIIGVILNGAVLQAE